jgi:hypothetical protein
MACYYAPNGQLSNLYEEAKSLYGDKVAKEIWYNVRTPEFIKEFGNWMDASKELSLYPKDSFEYRAVLASYSNISPFVDDNFEPKLMHFNEVSNNAPFKSLLSSFIKNDSVKRMINDSKSSKYITNRREAFNVLNKFVEEYNEDSNKDIHSYEGMTINVTRPNNKLENSKLKLINDRLHKVSNVSIPLAVYNLQDGKQAVAFAKVPGINAGMLSKAQIESIPTKDWIKLEKTARVLANRGVKVDLTKRSNLNYDRNKGFYFNNIVDIQTKAVPFKSFNGREMFNGIKMTDTEQIFYAKKINKAINIKSKSYEKVRKLNSDLINEHYYNNTPFDKEVNEFIDNLFNNGTVEKWIQQDIDYNQQEINRLNQLVKDGKSTRTEVQSWIDFEYIPNINKLNKHLNKFNKIKNYSEYLKDNINTLPFLANLINKYAKVLDNSFYSAKPMLVKQLATSHPETWAKGGIVYTETPLGQVSFHVFEGEDYLAEGLGLDNKLREWSGEPNQMVADDMLIEYLTTVDGVRNEEFDIKEGRMTTAEFSKGVNGLIVLASSLYDDGLREFTDLSIDEVNFVLDQDVNYFQDEINKLEDKVDYLYGNGINTYEAQEEVEDLLEKITRKQNVIENIQYSKNILLAISNYNEDPELVNNLFNLFKVGIVEFSKNGVIENLNVVESILIGEDDIKEGRMTKFDSSTFRDKNLNYIQDKFIKINPITEIYKEVKITEKERKEITRLYKNRELKQIYSSFENNIDKQKVSYNGFIYTFSWDLLVEKEKLEIVNKLDNLKRTPITDYYKLDSNVTSSITDIYEDKSKYYLKTIHNELFEVKKKDAFVLTSKLDDISDVNNIINNYTSDEDIKKNIIRLLTSGDNLNIEIVNNILFPELIEDDTKEGRMTKSSVDYTLKAVDILSSDKAAEVFEKGKKNNWPLEKILTELQIPKEQKQLILGIEFDMYVDELSLAENIAMELANRYTYNVEVNTSSTASPIGSGNVIFKLNDYMYIHNISFNKGFYKISFEDWQNNTGKLIPINSQEFTNARDIFEENNEQKITKDYFDLTAPGGIDYKINTFRTPGINNVISQDGEYHDNEFNRSRGDMIGWFRNDDKDSNKKVRRVLELQSFFQKVKDKEIIVTNDKISSHGKFVIDLNDYKETVKIDDPLFDENLALEYITYVNGRPFKHNHGVLYEDDINYYQQPDWGDDFLVIIPKDTLYNYEKDSQNDFLQLLNKNNNWVKFFLKSILQDSAKKGYEKVLFPTGETIIVIEQFKESIHKINEFNKVEKFLIDLKATDFIKDVSGKANYIGNDQEGYVDYERLLKSFYPNDAIENDETFDKARQQDLYRLRKDKSHYDNTEKQIQGTINFYENTLSNIIDKLGYNPNVITDEYGNTWNEVEIIEERDMSDIKLGRMTKSEGMSMGLDLIDSFINQPIDYYDQIEISKKLVEFIPEISPVELYDRLNELKNYVNQNGIDYIDRLKNYDSDYEEKVGILNMLMSIDKDNKDIAKYILFPDYFEMSEYEQEVFDYGYVSTTYEYKNDNDELTINMIHHPLKYGLSRIEDKSIVFEYKKTIDGVQYNIYNNNFKLKIIDDKLFIIDTPDLYDNKKLQLIEVNYNNIQDTYNLNDYETNLFLQKLLTPGINNDTTVFILESNLSDDTKNQLLSYLTLDLSLSNREVKQPVDNSFETFLDSDISISEQEDVNAYIKNKLSSTKTKQYKPTKDKDILVESFVFKTISNIFNLNAIKTDILMAYNDNNSSRDLLILEDYDLTKFKSILKDNFTISNLIYSLKLRFMTYNSSIKTLENNIERFREDRRVLIDFLRRVRSSDLKTTIKSYNKIQQRYIKYMLEQVKYDKKGKKVSDAQQLVMLGFKVKGLTTKINDSLNSVMIEKSKLRYVKRLVNYLRLNNFDSSVILDSINKELDRNKEFIIAQSHKELDEQNKLKDDPYSLKFGRMTQDNNLNEISSKIDNLNIPVDTKTNLKDLLFSGDQFNINKVIDFIDDEEDETERESLNFKEDVSFGTQPYFITSNNVKYVPEITADVISKARTQGYDVVKSDKETHVLNPKVTYSPTTGEKVDLNTSAISLVNKVMNTIKANSKSDIKKDYSSNKDLKIEDGVLIYNPSKITTETKITPALIFTSGVLNNKMLPIMIESYGNKNMVNEYKFVNSKSELDTNDYIKLAFDHLMSPELIKDNTLITFLDPIVAEGLNKSNRNDLNILSTVNDFNNIEEKFTRMTKGEPGLIEKSILSHNNEIIFDDSIEIDSDGNEVISRFTKLPTRKHKYTKVNGEDIDQSITGVVGEYWFSEFETIKYVEDQFEEGKYNNLSTAEKAFVKTLSKEGKEDFVKAVIRNDFSVFDYLLDDADGMVDDDPYDRVDYMLFVKLRDKLTSWEIRQAVGSQQHAILEGIMTDDMSEINKELDFIQTQIDDLSDLLTSNNSILPRFNDKNRTAESKYKQNTLTPDQLKLDYLYATLDFYNEMLAIRKQIEDRGGRIVTELIVHTDKMMNRDGSDTISSAGQIDMLAIYEDKVEVDPEYRGKVQIYDFKTMSYPPKESAPYYGKSSSGFQTGFGAKKQAQYALQLMLYKRILEEELGLNVMDVFIIPINIPSVNTDYNGNVFIDGHYDVVKVNDYIITEDDNGNIKMEVKKDGDQAAKTSIINIKTFSSTPIGDVGRVYSMVKKLVYQKRLPSKYDIKFGDDDIKKEKEDPFIVTDEIKKLKEDKLNNIIDDIKIYIQKRLNDINKSISNDPKEQSEQRAAMIKLQTDLNEIETDHKLYTFIQSSYFELYGTETKKGLKDKFEEIINAYNANDPDMSSDRAIAELNDIRMITENYNILDDIMNALLDGLKDNELNNLKQTEWFQDLETAIEIKKKLLDVRYDYEIKRILSNSMAGFLSSNADRAANDHIKSQELYYNQKIDRLKELIKTNPGGKNNYQARINRLESSKKKNLEYYKDVLIRNAETLTRDLTQLPRDIGFVERFLTAPISTSSSILSTYAMMLKFKLTEAEWDMKDIIFEVQQAAKELSSSVFDQGMFNFLPTEGDNPEKFYDPILETVKKWVRDPLTGEIKLADTVNLVSEFGTKKFKITNDDGTVTEEPMSYENIIKYYHHRLGKLRKENKFEEYRKLQEEYNKWTELNMERPFTGDYYTMNNLFTKDQIGIDAKKKREEIMSMINAIKDQVNHNLLRLTDDEIKAIRELQIEYKRLGSIYDEDGIKKDENSDDYKIAIRIQEFNKEFNKRHNYIINHEEFEKARQKAKAEFRDTPSKYKLWLEENTEIKIDDSLLERVSYLRKLKKVLRYAKNTGDSSLMIDVESIFNTSNDFKSFSKRVDEWYSDYKLDEVTETDEYELYEELNDILKPYKLGGSNIDTLSIPADVMLRVKAIEETLQELFEQNRISGQDVKEDPSWTHYFELNKGISEAINDIIEYVPNNDYYKKYQEKLEKAKENDMEFEETQWFLENHIETKDGPRPIRAWTITLPAHRMHKVSESYEIDKEYQLNQIKINKPGLNDTSYLKELQESRWYINTHNSQNQIKEESGYLLIDDNKTEGVSLSPNFKYSRSEVKKEYVRPNPEKFTDEKGYLLPIKSLWVNPKYVELKNTKWFKFYEVLMREYKEAQAIMPEAYRLGNKLPYIYKTDREHFFVGKFKQGFKTWWDNKFGNVATREMDDDMIMMNLTSSGDDIDSDEIGNQVIEGTATYATSLEKRTLPFKHVFHIDIDEVSRDAVSSILSYIAEAKRFKAKSEILPQVRSILNLTTKRDSVKGGGVIRRDVDDSKLIDAVAKKLNIQKFVRKEGESFEAALIRSFTEMQMFDDQNKEISSKISFFGKEVTIRVDKLLDTAMSAASFAQIGGITSSGWLKGFANYLQANVQMFLEGWAADHYNVKDWSYAKKLIYYGNGKIGALGVDILRDFGKLTNETLSGQLFEMYDALQGSFKDEFGNNISQSKLNEVMRSSTWFVNQQIGEIEAAGTSMYALLNSYKVLDNGEVYSLDDYLTFKTDEKKKATDDENASLDYKERNDITKEFRKIKTTLLDSMELGPDGRVMLKGVNDVEEGGVKVPFLKSHRNMKIRAKLHGINKDLHGNYNSFDKTDIQRHVGGRLLMMYRKYLVPMARRRWGKTYRNEEIGVVRQGFYMTFFGYLFSDFKRFGSIVWNSYFHQKDTGLQPFEEANIRRATLEIAIYIGLSVLASLLAVGDDEDDEDISTLRWITAYQVLRLKREIGSLAPSPTVIGDNWKVLKSPSAFNGFIDRTLGFFHQLFSDTWGVYEHKTGSFEKGDSKLRAKWLKLFGNFANVTDAQEAYKNLNRPMF